MKNISKSSNSNSSDLLSHLELKALDARIAANASKWLEDNAPIVNAKIPRSPKGNRGRKAKMILNPFCGYIGCFTYWGRYPVFALNIMEGVARLDWHDRPIGVGGKSMPLSVRNLAVILEHLLIVTNEAVEDLLQLGERHSRRYVKAIELVIPRMMECRPWSLYNEMEGINHEHPLCDWRDQDELCQPAPEVLEKLHYDLRTLTQHKTAEEYEAELEYKALTPNIIAFPTRQQHPKKALVLQMLTEGMLVKSIERETGVSAKTIRKWRDNMLAAQGELQSA